MNILDVIILLALGLFALAGYYKGFLTTLISIASYFVSFIFAISFMGVISNSVKADDNLFNTLLYYTEGSEFISDVELARANVSSLNTTQIDDTIAEANLPYPFAGEITENIAKEAFSDINITTLGDYFNQTIVCGVINILAFMLIFFIMRIILAFVANGIDYTLKLPKLKKYDSGIGAGLGVVNGMLSLFVAFMIVPIILIVLNFEFVHSLIDGSFFAPFFYNSSLFLAIIPGI
ncbi:MAG: CvpA family protein [Clostridia bacterium]